MPDLPGMRVCGISFAGILALDFLLAVSLNALASPHGSAAIPAKGRCLPSINFAV